MQASSAISISPSFNSYSNTKLAEIAARVVDELASQEVYDDEFYFEDISANRRSEEFANSDFVKNSVEEGDSDYVETEGENQNRVDDDEFEFAFVTTRDSDPPSPISADEIFHNGQIRPVYPVFNRDLFRIEFPRENRNELGENVPTIRLPLRKLFNEERETPMTMTTTSSGSSSDADELDGVPADSYCVWRPPNKAEAEARCKKSSSTGSNSKRWKFKVKDLLNRSRSEGSKDDFSVLNSSKKQSEDRGKVAPVSGGGTVKSAAAPPLPPLPVHGGEKRRSYLPYKQDLVGLFANVNGFSKNLQPF
ncbi:hypothetical protein SASPL_155067 [Salvia splendens]|uniref:Uncharacterized protein n=1 Tax=Salvia splendens TaxID=180675 RepID=A0A8X8W1Q1_SALSN|nr:uncharacterized protein LOC121785931 [Salvia splendens]KAG6386176.1 hypothetical protein SASPL_155067 [Salvia splendens]